MVRLLSIYPPKIWGNRVVKTIIAVKTLAIMA